MPKTVLRSVLVPPFPVGTPPISKTANNGPQPLGGNATKDDPRLSWPHVKFHQSVEQAVNSSAQIANGAPATPTSPGEAGSYFQDANFFYYCFAQNLWRRIPGSPW